MTLLGMVCADHDTRPSTLKTVARLLYAGIFILAIVLAIKDMNLLSSLSTKLWVLALAVILPELYVILHGISSSSMGVNFFTGSPIEARVKDWGATHDFGANHGGVKSKMPSHPAADLTSSTPSDSSSSLF